MKHNNEKGIKIRVNKVRYFISMNCILIKICHKENYGFESITAIKNYMLENITLNYNSRG
jgi:hypothetical protein